MAAPTLNFFYKNNTLSTVQTDNDHHVIVSANAHNLSETTRLEARLLATDVQQSTVTVASENRTAFAYGPYGHDDRHSDARVISRFTGQPWLPSAVGYMLGNGHRLFSPAMMRFYSADSLSPFEAGGLNAYAYCDNDPVNRSDPSGRYSIFKLLRGGYKPKTIIKNMMKEDPRLTRREYNIVTKYIDVQNAKADRELRSYQDHYQSRGDERVIKTSSLDHRLKSLIPDKPKGQKTRFILRKDSGQGLIANSASNREVTASVGNGQSMLATSSFRDTVEYPESFREIMEYPNKKLLEERDRVMYTPGPSSNAPLLTALISEVRRRGL